jgi:hypothetical protein
MSAVISDLFEGVTSPLDDALTLVNRCLAGLSGESLVYAINSLREEIHGFSPFSTEPVDFVRWVSSSMVHANDYNPNSVAPPEMELLRTSIREDGYTQPIVAMLDETGAYEVIDGFHRHRVGKECEEIQARVHGYLPLVQIRQEQVDKANRMASTIRHNRARGKHRVEAMSDIVIELKRRNWSDEKIASNLGMDADEVLRLCQITGLAEAFRDQDFSTAWEVGGDDGAGAEILSDVTDGAKPKSDSRILHTWDKWECFKAGFYAERTPKGMTQDDGEEAYRAFLADLPAFEAALHGVTTGWKHSCEHYLTNERMNRIAWLGQASVAFALGIPSGCRGGYQRLSQEQKDAADAMALTHLNKWLEANGREPVDFELAGGRTEAELY